MEHGANNLSECCADCENFKGLKTGGRLDCAKLYSEHPPYNCEQYKEVKVPDVLPTNSFTKDTPDYYKNGGVQPFDIMKEQGLFEDFAVACLIKYSMRLNTKGQYVSDLRKIKHYASELLELKSLKEGK